MFTCIKISLERGRGLVHSGLSSGNFYALDFELKLNLLWLKNAKQLT